MRGWGGAGRERLRLFCGGEESEEALVFQGEVGCWMGVDALGWGGLEGVLGGPAAVFGSDLMEEGDAAGMEIVAH